MTKSAIFQKIYSTIASTELMLRKGFIHSTLNPEMDDEVLEKTASGETVKTVKTMMEWYIPYLTTAFSAGITQLICDTFQDVEDDIDLKDYNSVDIHTED